MKTEDYETKNFKEIWQNEKDFLRIKNTGEAKGLALSGGGIRSASFGLGVVQALLEHGVMHRLDYLSTVSGGGYTGAALTWFRHRHARETGLHDQSFLDHTNPFGEKGKGVRSDTGSHNFLAYLRQHGNYLNPYRRLDFVSAVSVALRNLLISFSIYTALVIVALGMLMIVEHYAAQGLSRAVDSGKLPVFLKAEPELNPPVKIADAGQASQANASSSDIINWHRHSFFQVNICLAAVLLALFAIYGVMFSLHTFFAPYIDDFRPLSSYANRNAFQFISGLLLKFAGLFILLASLPAALAWVKGDAEIFGAAGAISGIWAAMSKFRTFLGKESLFKKVPWLGERLFEFGALIFIFAILVFAYHAGLLIGIPATMSSELNASAWKTLAWIGIPALVLAIFVNVNYASLGRMYRDRLMEAFLPDSTTVAENTWHPASEANDSFLEEMCRDSQGNALKPYHLINTNVILTRSRKEKYRRRGGDSFVLSPLYCGSDATEYIATASFMKGNRWLHGAGMRLATAMAISGAAANPHTGVAGKGPTRGPLVSILMTFFNLRLGAWVTNPRHGSGLGTMNYIQPGLCSLLPMGYKENSRYLELTDGGHFENLGLYELVRRRVGTIIVADAGVDIDFKFGDLANAIEKVRTDFGVSIRFEPEDVVLEKVLPGVDQSKAILKGLAAKAYMPGQIKYPPTDQEPAFTGTLIVLKTTTTPNLPVDLYSYRANHPAFPDQPTSDQFFDEKQFEAYRELGYRLADAMCDEACTLIFPEEQEQEGQATVVKMQA